MNCYHVGTDVRVEEPVTLRVKGDALNQLVAGYNRHLDFVFNLNLTKFAYLNLIELQLFL
jgi:hypothetical protein